MARLNRKRIRRLETKVGTGCSVCHGWNPTVIIDDDGNTTRPEWCSDCGRYVPVELYLHIVGVSLDAI
jgi:hypothetical protein